MNINVVEVFGSDGAALYVDGKLVSDHFTVGEQNIVKALGYTCYPRVEANEKWFAGTAGVYPENLADCILNDHEQTNSPSVIGIVHPTNINLTHEKHLNKAAGSFQYVRNAGIEPLTPFQFMEDVEKGLKAGVTLEQSIKELSKLKSDLEAIKSGKLSPSKVGGKGAGKQPTIEWLENRIADIQPAVDDSIGFHRWLNISNYCHFVNRQLVDAVNNNQH